MIYEFYISDILIRCDRCVKDGENFLHLYRNNYYVANINLDAYSVFVMHKSSNVITFGLKERRWYYGKAKFKFWWTIIN